MAKSGVAALQQTGLVRSINTQVESVMFKQRLIRVAAALDGVIDEIVRMQSEHASEHEMLGHVVDKLSDARQSLGQIVAIVDLRAAAKGE